VSNPGKNFAAESADFVHSLIRIKQQNSFIGFAGNWIYSSSITASVNPGIDGSIGGIDANLMTGFISKDIVGILD